MWNQELREPCLAYTELWRILQTEIITDTKVKMGQHGQQLSDDCEPLLL